MKKFQVTYIGNIEADTIYSVHKNIKDMDVNSIFIEELDEEVDEDDNRKKTVQD